MATVWNYANIRITFNLQNTNYCVEKGALGGMSTNGSEAH